MLQTLVILKRILKSALVLVNAIVPTFAGGQVDRWTWWWVACEKFWRNLLSFSSSKGPNHDYHFFSQGLNHAITSSSHRRPNHAIGIGTAQHSTAQHNTGQHSTGQQGKAN